MSDEIFLDFPKYQAYLESISRDAPVITKVISEMEATLMLQSIAREMPKHIGAPNLQVNGERCITGEMLARLGVLDRLKNPFMDDTIAGGVQAVMWALGGIYSPEFKRMLFRIMALNDQGITWGTIGKTHLGLAA